MTPLLTELLALIRQEGPIPVARYMDLALCHPLHGYYITRDPLGATGDFTTSPEISQVFGELIGLWCAQVWLDIGGPSRVILAECGPGRGTLMADVLRAAKAIPAFGRAVEIHLIETSPVLRDVQQRKLAPSGKTPVWHASLATLPEDAPLLLIGNEFLDALPIRQFQRMPTGWHERLVGAQDDRLVFGLSPNPETSLKHLVSEGAVLEICPQAITTMTEIGRRLSRQSGAALLIDYGHDRPGFGDTLQAIKAHAFVDPLATPGDADITAHVDFAAMAAAARAGGGTAHGPMRQGPFLTALGLRERAHQLASGADAAGQATVTAATARLTDMSRTGMGELFKVLAITGPDQPPPPGFA